MLFALFACQEEEFTVVESKEDAIGVDEDRQLTSLMKLVSSHDGSFDNVVDDSDCFSINYPYMCSYNGELYTVNSVEDLAPFNMYDELIPEFPITMTLANYIEVEVPNLNAFETLISQCQNGQLFNERITCIDFVYPISVAIYNTETTNFDTLIFNHDRDTFTSLDLINENTVASVNYPVKMTTNTGLILTFNSNEELKDEILTVIPLCD